MMYFDDDGRAFSVAWPDGVALMEPGQPLATYEQHLRDAAALAALPALIARHRADVTWGAVAPLAFQIADAFMVARAMRET